MSIEKRELNTRSMRGWSSSFQMEFVSMNRDKMEDLKKYYRKENMYEKRVILFNDDEKQ